MLQAIIAQTKITLNKVEQVITREMNDFVKLTAKYFDETVSTWKTKPIFSKSVKSNKNSVTGEVSTDNEIYRYVSGGTKPHRIPKSGNANLRFKSQYTAKTSPGRISARNGGASGSYVHAKFVQHPGTKAREFDKQIKDALEKDFSKLMLVALLDVMEEI